MSKKSSSARKVPINVVKKYASFIRCASCGDERPAKRIVIVSTKTKKGWACTECSGVTFEAAVTREV